MPEEDDSPAIEALRCWDRLQFCYAQFKGTHEYADREARQKWANQVEDEFKNFCELLGRGIETALAESTATE